MVRTTLNGFSGAWNASVKGVVSREHKPRWEKLWDDFIQEETRDEALRRQQSKGGEIEENVVFNVKSKKITKKKYLSKIVCFHCKQFRHYAPECPEKKGKVEKDTTTSTSVEEYVAKFEQEFSSFH